MTTLRIATLIRTTAAVLAGILATASAETRAETDRPAWAIAIHGGAGTMPREQMTPETEARIRGTLAASLAAGSAVLETGGAAMDAVEAAIIVLEDSPDFNAGYGAVFDAEGEHELDASIMDGATLNAGAVAGVMTVKNPIIAARAVMDHSPDVLLEGEGADEFAAEQGLELVPNDYFSTAYRREQLENAKSQKKGALETSTKYGTVGAVARDRNGDLAAATSTGGLTNKTFGRVGDSPIIGAGTYAANGACAVSGTGEGEYFIRLSVARTVCAEITYNEVSVGEAARRVIQEQLTGLGGTGGVIAIDSNGEIALDFNTPGMYRGKTAEGSEIQIAIYR
jgi:beta-aspartyl-peptidase (threonine type)